MFRVYFFISLLMSHVLWDEWRRFSWGWPKFILIQIVFIMFKKPKTAMQARPSKPRVAIMTNAFKLKTGTFIYLPKLRMRPRPRQSNRVWWRGASSLKIKGPEHDGRLCSKPWTAMLSKPERWLPQQEQSVRSLHIWAALSLNTVWSVCSNFTA